MNIQDHTSHTLCIASQELSKALNKAHEARQIAEKEPFVGHHDIIKKAQRALSLYEAMKERYPAKPSIVRWRDEFREYAKWFKTIQEELDVVVPMELFPENPHLHVFEYTRNNHEDLMPVGHEHALESYSDYVESGAQALSDSPEIMRSGVSVGNASMEVPSKNRRPMRDSPSEHVLRSRLEQSHTQLLEVQKVPPELDQLSYEGLRKLMFQLEHVSEEYIEISRRLVTLLLSQGRHQEAKEQEHQEQCELSSVSRLLRRLEKCPNHVSTTPPVSPVGAGSGLVETPQEKGNGHILRMTTPSPAEASRGVVERVNAMFNNIDLSLLDRTMGGKEGSLPPGSPSEGSSRDSWSSLSKTKPREEECQSESSPLSSSSNNPWLKWTSLTTRPSTKQIKQEGRSSTVQDHSLRETPRRDPSPMVEPDQIKEGSVSSKTAGRISPLRNLFDGVLQKWRRKESSQVSDTATRPSLFSRAATMPSQSNQPTKIPLSDHMHENNLSQSSQILQQQPSRNAERSPVLERDSRQHAPNVPKTREHLDAHGPPQLSFEQVTVPESAVSLYCRGVPYHGSSVEQPRLAFSSWTAEEHLGNLPNPERLFTNMPIPGHLAGIVEERSSVVARLAIASQCAEDLHKLAIMSNCNNAEEYRRALNRLPVNVASALESDSEPLRQQQSDQAGLAIASQSAEAKSVNPIRANVTNARLDRSNKTLEVQHPPNITNFNNAPDWSARTGPSNASHSARPMAHFAPLTNTDTMSRWERRTYQFMDDTCNAAGGLIGQRQQQHEPTTLTSEPMVNPPAVLQAQLNQRSVSDDLGAATVSRNLPLLQRDRTVSFEPTGKPNRVQTSINPTVPVSVAAPSTIRSHFSEDGHQYKQPNRKDRQELSRDAQGAFDQESPSFPNYPPRVNHLKDYYPSPEQYHGYEPNEPNFPLSSNQATQGNETNNTFPKRHGPTSTSDNCNYFSGQQSRTFGGTPWEVNGMNYPGSNFHSQPPPFSNRYVPPVREQGGRHNNQNAQDPQYAAEPGFHPQMGQRQFMGDSSHHAQVNNSRSTTSSRSNFHSQPPPFSNRYVPPVQERGGRLNNQHAQHSQCAAELGSPQMGQRPFMGDSSNHAQTGNSNSTTSSGRWPQPTPWDHDDDYKPPDAGPNTIDLRKEILRELRNPRTTFDGSRPEQFEKWRSNMCKSLKAVGCSAELALEMLERNTSGGAFDIVKGVRMTGATDSDSLAEVWRRLRRRFGDTTLVAEALARDVVNRERFPDHSRHHKNYEKHIKDLEQFIWLCKGLRTGMNDHQDLRHFDSRVGLQQIVSKMPMEFERDWELLVNKLKNKPEAGESARLPVLDDMIALMEEYIIRKSDPYFLPSSLESPARKCFHTRPQHNQSSAPEEKTSMDQTARPTMGTTGTQTVEKMPAVPKPQGNQGRHENSGFPHNNPGSSRPPSLMSMKTQYCFHHRNDSHDLKECPIFLQWTPNEKMELVRSQGLCFRCLGQHYKQRCKSLESCNRCRFDHHSLLHGFDQFKKSYRTMGQFKGRTCTKTVPVVVRCSRSPNEIVETYCMIDEQSNSCFTDPELINALNPPSAPMSYALKTMAGLSTQHKGLMVWDLEVRALEGGDWISLPDTFSSPHLPVSKDDVAIKEDLLGHPHISEFAKHFPTTVKNLPVWLLVGSDCGEATHTITHGDHAPYVHENPLGWAVVGRVGVDHQRDTTPSCFRSLSCQFEHQSAVPSFGEQVEFHSSKPFSTFREASDDELPGQSRDDLRFLQCAEESVQRTDSGHLMIALPFKENFRLPKNREAVRRRAINSLNRIAKKPELAASCQETMQKYLDAGHVEELKAGEPEPMEMTSHIPVFPVIHPRKGKVRLVFDSSARYQGTCLNENLLCGPNVNNKLAGVLIRFRLEEVGFSADVEAMYHGFYVPPHQRDSMRFFWWAHNQVGAPVSTYRPNVHIFGNRSSPAIAQFGLRFCTRQEIAKSKPGACALIHDSFYVDDLLSSAKTCEYAVSLLRDTIEILQGYKLRLHKIISSHKEVLNAFPASELAADMDELELNSEASQSALGLSWKMASDKLILKYQDVPRAFTRRAVLSQVGSVFDPLGFAAPTVLALRLLQRKFLSSRPDEGKPPFSWDEPLPEHFRHGWNCWVSLLPGLTGIEVDRCYVTGLDSVTCQELFVFCDASEQAIAYVMYLRSTDLNNKVRVAFVCGSAKVTPRAATSIPRWELCSAVEAVQAAKQTQIELGLKQCPTYFFSDSAAVLGYIRNTSKTFKRYVSARIQVICSNSKVEQWHFIPSAVNPADIGTHPRSPKELLASCWLTGPEFLRRSPVVSFDHLLVPAELAEVDASATTKCLRTTIKGSDEDDPLLGILKRCSSWRKALNVCAIVLHFADSCKRGRGNYEEDLRPDMLDRAKQLLLGRAQFQCFPDSIKRLFKGKKLQDHDKLLPLGPFIYAQLVRVGGRLRHSSLAFDEKHPFLLPSKHRITELIVREAHQGVSHQGRHLTAAAVRRLGYHIISMRRVVSNYIKKCVTCRRLRGRPITQIMADLPSHRLEKIPPFSSCGVDVMGPFIIHDGRSTRRTPGTKKVWALLVTCLYSRAIHVELLSSLDSVTFQLALRRFVAVRGTARYYRSDKGTNFVGIENQRKNELSMSEVFEQVKNQAYTWDFQPPKAPHYGGVWERKVGDLKRIIEGTLTCLKRSQTTLSREEFLTFLMEAAAIVNLTPLGEVHDDPNEPFPVSPSTLLTLREDGFLDQSCTLSSNDLLSYGKLRWQRVQKLADIFWQRWKEDYLQSLITRSKWHHPSRELQIGDIVLINDTTPRNKWEMGRVICTKLDDKGLVRTVDVKLKPTQNEGARTIERAIQYVTPLLKVSELKESPPTTIENCTTSLSSGAPQS